MHPQEIDLAIIIIIALSVLTGVIRGFLKELIALCVWILALWLAFNYSEMFSVSLQKYIQDKTTRTVVAFIIILVATLILGGIVNAMLSFIIKRTGLSSTDRLLGMGFGFIRGVFIVALIITVLKMTAVPINQYTQDSELYNKFTPVVDWLEQRMPDFMGKMKQYNDKKSNLMDFKLKDNE